MNRLKRYLVGQFTNEAVTLFAVAISIIFLVECLRIVDAGSVRGQGLIVLGTQVFVSLPSAAMAFVHVCLGIGLARALRTMQSTRELHILHVSGKLGALAGAVAIYAAAGAAVLLLLAHVVDPLASRENSAIRSRVAADLLGRSLVPNRFAEVTDGVTVTVGGRRAGGEITSFFADDRRQETRKTYIAESAVISLDDEGYVLQLINGTVQYRTPEGKFSEISYDHYDLAFERLTGEADTGSDGASAPSHEIVLAALEDGWSDARMKKLSERTVEGLRALSICLFVFALAGFPNGRRREPRLPIEITVLGAAFFERVLYTYAPGDSWLSPLTGILVLSTISLVILVFQLKPFARPRRESKPRRVPA
jgi:lipopolysaccharide export system permease protein